MAKITKQNIKNTEKFLKLIRDSVAYLADIEQRMDVENKAGFIPDIRRCESAHIVATQLVSDLEMFKIWANSFEQHFREKEKYNG